MNKTPKIAIEEHYSAPGFAEYSNSFTQHIPSQVRAELAAKLVDLDAGRIAEMDAGNIEFIILSQSGPGVQAEVDEGTAIRRAQENNDFLAERVARHPKRFGGFAHIAMHDPQEAARELDRAVTQLGFKGAMINGHTLGRYYDSPIYDVFWDKAEKLKAPIYLHPREFSEVPALLEGHPVLHGATWGWGVETAGHALRLLFSGVFDRFPSLLLVLGHMGEFLPFQRWRFDSRFAAYPHGVTLKKKPSEYFGSNIVITTSGVCSAPTLIGAVAEMGANNVLFSIDYPYESTALACEFIEGAALDDATRALVCHENARRIFRL
jgi:2,3-dihydroxybenzoate decarboxylase